MGRDSELGFGIMRMPMREDGIDWKKSKELVDEYMKGEYCYFDTHPAYMMNQSQRIIKELVVKRYARDRFRLADKIPYYGITAYHDYESILEQELRECGVEYFDYYLMHAVSEDVYAMHEKMGGFDFLRKVKEEGKARNIGFSFHDKPKLLDRILEKYRDIDFVQLQINYVDWENPVIQSKSCYEVARKHNKNIIVMEPIKGGCLARGEDPRYNAKLALQFVKNLPGIKVILSGMNEIEQVKDNRETVGGKNSQPDFHIYKELQEKMERQNVIPCTLCGYCERECAQGIKIPEIFTLINTYYRPGIHDRTIDGRISMLYKNLVAEGAAGKCVGCGKCEKRCPQKIPIRENLRKAVTMFEKKHFYTSERNAQILIYLMKEYGIKKIVSSPGATNAAFVYSVQQDDFFEIYSAPDERSAAYIACGLARESGETVALSCTGATASRNYVPGLTEAFYRNIPILAITSAQPDCRIGHNLPQVIDRTKMQNDIVKMSVEMPLVKDDEDEWSCVLNANKALNELWNRSPGPVHINLITIGNQDFSVRTLPYVRVIRRIHRGEECPAVPDGKIGIFCGEHGRWDDRLRIMVDSFCEKYDAVVICDHTSNYSGKNRWTPTFLNRRTREDSLYDIDLLIHIGNISGAYFPIRAKEVWRVHTDGEYRDTFKKLSYVFAMDEFDFFKTYVQDVQNLRNMYVGNQWPGYAENLREDAKNMPFSNAWVASQTAHLLPSDSVLHLAILNSLRVWNYYSIPENVRVYSNTGGFGIDGCLSTLVGASLADPDKLYFGVIGDLAFFYDMNVLGNRHIGKNIRLLVINNGCGTEFKNYSHAAKIFGEQTDLFIAAKGHYGNQSEKLLRDYAEALGFLYKAVRTKEEYLELLPWFLNMNTEKKSVIIEIFTDSGLESEALRLLNEEEDKAEFVNREQEKMVPDWIEDLSEKEVVLWGCGHCLFQNISKVEQYCSVRYVCDNDPKKWNTDVLPGIRCISPDQLSNKDNIFVVIMLEDGTVGFDIVHQLQSLEIKYFDIVKNWLKYAKKLNWRGLE